MKLTKKSLLSLVLLAASGLAMAADKHSAEDIKKDIAHHRAMAAAHETAAKCLESGKKEDVCVKDLQAACKGLGIGKYCGMKHEH
jgi:uncharacterized protein YgiB involved in biofilm formation